MPRHVGVILDGNRRWARDGRRRPPRSGHQAGADKIQELLGWCEEVGVEVVTLWLLSTDNLNRPAAELGPLLGIIEETVDATWPRPAAGGCTRWARSTCCPTGHRERAQGAADATARRRRPHWSTSPSATAAAARSPTRSARCSRSTPPAGTSIEELAEVLDVEHIAEHLYTRGQPDPDLVIRTSGEQRLSGFLLWQSAHSRVLLLRGLLAGLPQGRLPARAAVVRARDRRFGA